MVYKGILLDLDDTLYNYEKPNKQALENVFSYCSEIMQISKDEVKSAYFSGRAKVHIDLKETAASHNRLLYIQKMLEILNYNPLISALEIYDIYWNTFLEKMELFDGVISFFEKYEGKICIITDLTAHIQYRKIRKLNLPNYINSIVTSEETGKEKPHPFNFILALNKLKLNVEDVVMIGDNFDKDILGATNLKINSIWINHKNKTNDYDKKFVTEVNSFDDIRLL